MSLASSTNLILAGIHDNTNALKNPSAGSPLAPLTDSHVEALNKLSNLITGLCATSTAIKEKHPAASLRVHPPPAVPIPPDIPTQPKQHHPHVSFTDVTGPTGRRNRQRKQRPTVKLAPPSEHSAAAANIIFPSSPPLTDTFTKHYACHGNAFNRDTTGQIADYPELSRSSDGALWIASCADEFCRLCQGHGTAMPTGTNTMKFIPVTAIPSHKKPTYLRMVAAYCPEKTNPRHVCFTVGGDRILYDGDVSTKTADLTTVKILLNSVISTPAAKFMTGDLKDFYLETPMPLPEYMRIPTSIIPPSIMTEYNLDSLIHRDHVYVEFNKGMYGLPQAGRLANDQLIAFLAPHGYAPVDFTPGLWKHHTRDIQFTLVVDDFCIKYTNCADAKNLMSTLRLQYQVSEDWQGARYCGLTIEWDYTQRFVDISIPGYIPRALQRFQHPMPLRPQHAPHTWPRTTYGAHPQLAPVIDNTPALDAKDTKRVQELLGTLLSYA